MIYFIVTTSIFKHCIIRQRQYCNGINKLKNSINIDNDKFLIIIVENNGTRKTFLDDLGCNVYYTNNNFLPTKDKGYKELKDILDCITKYNMKDSDFIVKMTGRYILNDKSEFINNINNLNMNYDCVIKYGSYEKPVNYKVKDCITGLIGMRCKFVKKIRLPNKNENVEWNWAKVTYLIDDKKICKVTTLGINICPNGNMYFLR